MCVCVCVCVRSEGEMGGAIDGGEAWRRREDTSSKWQAIRSDNESTEIVWFRAQRSGWPYTVSWVASSTCWLFHGLTTIGPLRDYTVPANSERVITPWQPCWQETCTIPNAGPMSKQARGKRIPTKFMPSCVPVLVTKQTSLSAYKLQLMHRVRQTLYRI